MRMLGFQNEWSHPSAGEEAFHVHLVLGEAYGVLIPGMVEVYPQDGLQSGRSFPHP
jgi:hypothetical protein